MVADFKPEAPTYSWQKVSTKSSRLSYAVGIVKGIEQDVDKTIETEKRQREQQMEKKRLAATRGEAYQESDDEADGDNKSPGFSLASPEAKQKNLRTFDPQVNAGNDDAFDGANADSLFDHVDDPSLPALDRVKRDLAKEVLHISLDEGKEWGQEQKAHWKENLPKEKFKEVWKDAKDYAFDVWKVSQKDGFPK